MRWTFFHGIVVALVLVLIGIGVALWFTNGAPSPSAGPQAAMEQVQDLGQRFQSATQHRRDLRPFAQEARELIEQHPDSAPARLLYAQVLLAMEQVGQALPQLEKSLELDPHQPEVHVLAGSMAMQMGDLDQAVEHYRQAVQQQPNESQPRLHLANARLKQQEYDRARNVLLTVLEQDASLHKAHALLADVYAAQGELELATDQVRRALELVDEDEPAVRTAYIHKRARLLLRANRPTDAEMVLYDLPREQLLQPPTAEIMGQALLMQDRPLDAAIHYQRVLATDPQNADAAAKAARWYLRAGRQDLAQPMIQQLQRLDPTHDALDQLTDR